MPISEHVLRESAAGRPAGAAVVTERIPAAADTDTATAQTVRKMAEYIRAAVSDRGVRAAADYAWRHFGQCSELPAMKAWAAFWYVKHCVKFRLDEATMFRLNQQGEYDLLISPAVLVRMPKPAEDCDGFTMLVAAICSILNVPVVIATVAAAPDRPGEWSHVFPCALLSTRVLPLDASHGSGPGWMVPREHIQRWQAWDLSGKKTNVPMPFAGLHNYVRKRSWIEAGPARRGRRGMGSLGDCSDPTDPSCDFSTMNPTYTAPESPYPVVFSPTPAAPSNVPIAAATIGADISSALSRIFAPPAYQQTTYNPQTGQSSTTTIAAGSAVPGASLLGSSSAGFGSSGLLMLLLVGGVVLFASKK